MKKFVQVLTLSLVIGVGSVAIAYTQGHSEIVYAETVNVEKTTSATTTEASTSITTDEVVDLSPKAREYSASELSDNYTSSETITLKDGASSSTDSSVKVSGNTITITEAGTYVISGTLSDGQIVVDTTDEEKVQLVLNGVTITNSTQSPIYIKKAKDYAMITLKAGTTNTLTDNETYTLPTSETEELDATIYSKADLVINGTGSLVVNANFNDGIKTNDSLHIVSGNITVDAVHDAIYAKDAITIDDGNLNIVTKDGSENKVMEFEQMGGGGFGGQMPEGMTPPTDGQMPTGMTPPTDGQMPEGMTPPTDGQMPTGMTPPTDGQMPTGMTPPTDGQMPQGMTPPDGQMGGRGMRGQGTGMDAQTSASVTQPTAPTSTSSTTTTNQVTKPTTTTSTTDATTTTTEEDEESNKGLKSKGEIVINGGTFTIDSYDDAIKAGTFLEINDGTFDIKSGDDALKGDYILTINGGDINIGYCYEGIESEKVYLNGGNIDVISKDDGINASLENSTTSTMHGNPAGSDVAVTEADPIIIVDGANVKVNADGDAIDSNGGFTMNSGVVEVHGVNNGGELAMDFDKQALINGGDLLVLGGAGNLSSSSTQNVITTTLSSQAASGSTLTVKNSSGTVLFSTVLERNTTAVTFSSSDIVKGQTYTISDGTNTTTITASTTSTVTGTSQGMGGGKGMGGQRPDATTSATVSTTK